MPNRLAEESSPYLLQHANNPVDWYPWGPEALRRASDEDKPIFLSIGYSACHWCHVMEHESFEDEGIAKVLNENFVSVKVDREERPDLDQIYMNAVMALRNGQGGWPLSAFLTPEQEVFFGGTYWPPKSRMGMPGFDHVLMSVLDAFQNRRQAVNDQSKQITAWLNQRDNSETVELSESLLVTAAETLERQFDFQNGGFGTAPKFPHAMDLSLLIRLADRWDSDHNPTPESLLKMVRLNLVRMARGGIYDHLGGGFARYSVDESWLVPHFEKMLYDNALLAGTYLDMFEFSQDPFFAGIARETLDYVLHYLTDENGAFYSTEDADSEGVEGKFYVWSQDEIESLLEPAVAQQVCEIYDVSSRGNFEGANILNLTRAQKELVESNGQDLEPILQELQPARELLLKVRDLRVRPGLDDKVLVSWNALAIRSFARASYLLEEPRYFEAAAKSANFLLSNLRRDDGRLLHTWRNGVAKLDAYLDDYSYLILSLTALYDASHDERWIDVAIELTEQMIEHFGDDGAGFFFTAADHEALIARSKEFQDSSVPSGNSMAACALTRLGQLTGRSDWLAIAEKTAQAAVGLMKRSPLASGQMLIAVEQFLSESSELVLVAEKSEQIERLKQLARKHAPKHSVLICRAADQEFRSSALDKVLEGKMPVDGNPTLYICQGFRCQSPVVGVDRIQAALGIEA